MSTVDEHASLLARLHRVAAWAATRDGNAARELTSVAHRLQEAGPLPPPVRVEQRDRITPTLAAGVSFLIALALAFTATRGWILPSLGDFWADVALVLAGYGCRWGTEWAIRLAARRRGRHLADGPIASRIEDAGRRLRPRP